MRIGRLNIFWFGIIWYGKPYTSRGGYKCRYWHAYELRKTLKNRKRWGYWQTWYDGPFHFFGLGHITFAWSHRPEPIED